MVCFGEYTNTRQGEKNKKKKKENYAGYKLEKD